MNNEIQVQINLIKICLATARNWQSDLGLVWIGGT